ncbi:unnamed protein product [Zymoseptoria tritici ST99CH_3D7]|uniref:Serine hydrolase domain-containing protein n=2 Tax=Zymoseptoria TaxID=1047167 RepID=A0A1X7RSN5_ZYMT9|nr:unnamed protein product [Zymoseptoria tritici ST99CH_3D7]
MKFLCLHGAIGNTENFSIQLQPLETELAAHSVASFQYINGPCIVDPPEGFEQYFGAGPHYRWFDDGGAAEQSMITRIRKLPNGETPEDVIRASASSSNMTTMEWRNKTQLLDLIYETLENDPEIQGIIGYSEGAGFAASLVLDEMDRFQREGRPRRLKCAMFITGWPPIGPSGGIVLSDETDLKLDIPTLHVIGASDPYKVGAIALFNVCNPDTAMLFDTGKGHTIPRAGLVLQEWREAFEETIAIAERN